MDLKGPIIDTKIKIKASQRLIQYIKHIPFKDDMPENIVRIIKGVNYQVAKPSGEIKPKIELALSSRELDILTNLIPDVKIDDDEETEQNLERGDGKIENKKPKEITHSEQRKEEVQEKNDDSQRLVIGDIDWLYTYLQEHKTADVKDVPYLHELLEGCEVETPHNAVLKRNPDLEARCVKLRAQQEAREYRAMTKGVDNVRIRFPEDSISYQMKQLNRQLIAVGQFLLSIFAGFLFGFKGVELMIGGFDFGLRLLLGVMCALIIALAEIYFLAKKLNEELSIPETTQLGGPPKFANRPDLQIQPKTEKANKKEHHD